MLNKLILTIVLVALSQVSLASSKIVAHCYDHRVDRITTYTGTSSTIKEYISDGRLKVILQSKSVYFPLHMCTIEHFN